MVSAVTWPSSPEPPAGPWTLGGGGGGVQQAARSFGFNCYANTSLSSIWTAYGSQPGIPVYKQRSLQLGAQNTPNSKSCRWIKKWWGAKGPCPSFLLPSLPLFLPLFLKTTTALLKNNAHTTQSTHLKCTIQWLLVYSQSCATMTMLDFRTFFIISPKKP